MISSLLLFLLVLLQIRSDGEAQPTLAFRPSASAFPLAVCIPPRPAPAARALFVPGIDRQSDFRIRALCLRSAATGDDDGPQLGGPPLRMCGVGLGVRLRLGLWRRQCIRRCREDRVRGSVLERAELARRTARWLSRKTVPRWGSVARARSEIVCERRGWIGKFQHGTWDMGSVTVT